VEEAWSQGTRDGSNGLTASPPPEEEIDVRKEAKIHDLDFSEEYDHWQRARTSVDKIHCNSCPRRAHQARELHRLHTVRKRHQKLQKLLSDESLALFPDFQQRLKVLKTLGYLSLDDAGTDPGMDVGLDLDASATVVQLKGRVACEVNTCEELILTELIFENVLTDLEPEEIVSLLSSLVFQERAADEPTLTPRLEAARDKMLHIADSLAGVQLECGLDIDPEEFRKCCNFGMMEVVYEWARGVPFREICELTTTAEGTIVRCITRLDEVCREVRNSARVIGDPALYRKMLLASELIKRDIVFATSLYVSG